MKNWEVKLRDQIAEVDRFFKQTRVEIAIFKYAKKKCLSEKYV